MAGGLSEDEAREPSKCVIRIVAKNDGLEIGA